MPNHVTNVITSNNLALIADLMTDNDGKVTFDKVVPMPAGMIDIVEGSVLMTLSNLYGDPSNQFSSTRDIENDLKMFQHLKPEDFEMFAKALRLKQETGHWGWYGWSIENWGTKWDAYDAEVGDGAIVFDTAWSPPDAYLKALAARLPVGVVFTNQWSDEGGPSDVDTYEGSATA